MEIIQGMRVIPQQPVGRPARMAKEGVVLHIDGLHACIEFEEHINGHDGGHSPIKGRMGHCWWVALRNLKGNLPMDNQSAISLLKEGL